MAQYWQEGDPYSVVAPCTQEQALALINFDHHRVVVNDRWAILLTYHWMSDIDTPESLLAQAVLYPAPTHVTATPYIRDIIQKHPLAPEHVQAVIDSLVFTTDL